MAYARLVRDVPAPEFRMPEHYRRQVRSRLDAVVSSNDSGSSLQQCCLYLRQKRVFVRQHGTNKLPVRDTVRDGSPLEDYLDSVRLLNQAGYQVLLTGDASLPDIVYQEFRGMLVDARHVGVNEQTFYLYAATESDIFVGEAGGGNWLPGISQIPRLILNAFPYCMGFSRSWVYFKGVTDERGNLLPYQKLFRDHAHDFTIPGATVRTNTKEEITGAIAQFLEDVKQPWDMNANGLDQSLFAVTSWIPHSGGKLSPAWVRRYATGTNGMGATETEPS